MDINIFHSQKTASKRYRQWVKTAGIVSTAMVASTMTAPTVMASGDPFINFSYAPGTSLQQMLGFEVAGRYWDAMLADDVNLNFYVQTSNDLSEINGVSENVQIIGGALPGIEADEKYSDFLDAHYQDISSAEDQSAFYNLPYNYSGSGIEKFEARIDLGPFAVIENSSTLNLTRANSKALGMLTNQSNQLDGVVLMSHSLGEENSWNYDVLSNPNNNQVDFFSVAVHEIGHNLGFVSGVDQPGWLSFDNHDDFEEGFDNDDDFYNYLEGRLDYAQPLDMFRYSAESVSMGSWLPDLSVGVDAFFSIDGGATNQGNFSTGQDTSVGGDGFQASHWKTQNDPIGIMDPLIFAGQRRTVSSLDLLAFEVIGWDLEDTVIDLAGLQADAIAYLADEFDVSEADIIAVLNGTASQSTLEAINNAVDYHTQDRTQEVELMVQQSEIYEWGWSSGGSASSGSGWWQGLPILAQELNGVSSAADNQVTAVPESNATTGVMTLGVLGILDQLRRRRGRK